MTQKVLDLDKEDLLILVTCGSTRHALDRAKIVELLGGKDDGKRSLASLAKLLGAYRDGLPADASGRILGLLNAFDGRIPVTSTSQLGHVLQSIADHNSASAELRKGIRDFLNKYPQLQRIRARQ